jgi:hypothetical protein
MVSPFVGAAMTVKEIREHAQRLAREAGYRINPRGELEAPQGEMEGSHWRTPYLLQHAGLHWVENYGPRKLDRLGLVELSEAEREALEAPAYGKIAAVLHAEVGLPYRAYMAMWLQDS